MNVERKHCDAPLVPARRSRRFTRVFAAYCRRLMKRRFNAVRIARGSAERLQDAAGHDGPVLLALNHPSWWDPLLALLLVETLMQRRNPFAPIDAEQLRRFRFMTRIGLFGIEPGHPQALSALTDYVAERFATDRNAMFVITPQGAFADVRERIRLRPGAATVAARHPGVRVVLASFEYVFWLDQRPEALVRVADCAPPERCSIAGWHRSLTRGMQANADALAELSRGRDEAAFESLLESRVAVHPLYDRLLRLRGQSPRLTRRAVAASRSEEHAA